MRKQGAHQIPDLALLPRANGIVFQPRLDIDRFHLGRRYDRQRGRTHFFK